MTCKDCIHNVICSADAYFKEREGAEAACVHFKPKSCFIELPCAVGDTVYCDICNEGKGYYDSCIIKSIELEKDYPEPLFTAVCYDRAEYQTYWASDFGKEIFLEPHEPKKKQKKHLRKGARGNDQR